MITLYEKGQPVSGAKNKNTPAMPMCHNASAQGFQNIHFTLLINPPLNDFSVMSGKNNHYLVITQYYGEKICVFRT